MERFGRIDVAVTAAGVLHYAPLEEIDEAEWEATMGANLKGTYLVTQAVLPHLRAEPRLPDHNLVWLRHLRLGGRDGLQRVQVGSARLHAIRPAGGARRRRTRDGDLPGEGCDADARRAHEHDPDLLVPEDVADAVRWLLSLRPIVQIKDLMLERTTA